MTNAQIYFLKNKISGLQNKKATIESQLQELDCYFEHTPAQAKKTEILEERLAIVCDALFEASRQFEATNNA